jgi:hypothetical protein
MRMVMRVSMPYTPRPAAPADKPHAAPAGKQPAPRPHAAP